MITAVVLALLAVVWMAVLVPPLVRGRRANRTDSVESFQSQLSVLDKHTAAPPTSSVIPESVFTPTVVPAPEPEPVKPPTRVAPPLLTPGGRAKARRRQVFTALVAAVPVSLVLAVAFQGWFILAQVVVDLALIGFVTLQMRAQRISAEQEIKVAFLPHADAGAEPTMLLESVSNS